MESACRGSVPALVVIAVSVWWSGWPLEARDFIRGDANQDDRVDVSDPRFSLDHLFLGGPAPLCLAAADANDDEKLDIADAIATLGFLFLGDAALPPPGPRPGPDPTPGAGCGPAGLRGLVCAASGPAVELAWSVDPGLDAVEVFRDGEAVASLAGDARRHRDLPAAGGTHVYELRGRIGRNSTEAVACTVSGLPDNRPPALALLAPAQGAVIDAAVAPVRLRIQDEAALRRIVIGGIDVEPPAAVAGAVTVTADVPLRAGPNLVRIEAVDEFGRASFLELALGRTPLLRRGEAARGLLLDIAGTSGFDEIEGIVQPLLGEVPSLVDRSVRGVVLYEDEFLGVGLRVTGNRAEVSLPMRFDLLPSDVNGGRVILRVRLDQVRVFADGRSDFGFLGTDAWTATWTASGVAIEGAFALVPAPGGGGLQAVSDGFVASIGSSNTSVSGFLDPFGIFDGLVNLLADLFEEQIRTEVRAAVERAANEELVPAVAGAFSGLSLDFDLGAVALDSRFHDVVESSRGLAVFLDTAWTGARRSPAFPPFPGSLAASAPFPAAPIDAAVGHAVDATISLAAGGLNQALAELAAGGLLETAFSLEGAAGPFALNAGTLAVLIDPRLATLPGVTPEAPLGLAVHAEMAPSLTLVPGPVGAPIVPAGAEWKYLLGREEPPAAWKSLSFDDGGWAGGASGFGYSSDDRELDRVRTRLPEMAEEGIATLYARAEFQLADPAALRGLFLRVLHDDGFAAFLNGVEVARVNLSGAAGSPVPYSQLASAAIEPALAAIDLASSRHLLRAGRNVLAIQGHNAAAGSSDFVLAPQLLEPLPAPAGVLGRIPAEIAIEELVVAFQADTAADGVGSGDADGRVDEVDLLALRLRFALEAAVAVRVSESGAPVLAFDVDVADGPDVDLFPDALIGGADGVRIAMARESFDVDDVLLEEFGKLALGLLGSSLGEALAEFALPAFELPELSFDLDGNGVEDLHLRLSRATPVAVDSSGDGAPDWVCILGDLEPAR